MWHIPCKLQENMREACCPQGETSKLGSQEDTIVYGNFLVLVSMIFWCVCQNRIDTIEYRELWRARSVWSSAGDTQINVSCATILPWPRAATNHSRSTVRMIHLGGSNLRFLFMERCAVHGVLTSDLFPTFYYPLASPPSVQVLKVEGEQNSGKAGLERKNWMCRWSQRALGQSQLVE